MSASAAAIAATAGWSPFIPPGALTDSQLFFFTAAYGYILFKAANILNDGSELLLLVPSISGIIGTIVLPVLGAVPDGMMVLFSGFGPDAQKQLSVGVGTLAGSTIMLLTIPWFLATFGGRVSLRAPKVKASMTLENVDYDALEEVDQSELEEHIQERFAEGVGMDRETVDVTFTPSKRATKVECEFNPGPTTSRDIVAVLKKFDFSSHASEAAAMVDGVKNAARGRVVVSKATVTSTSETLRATYKKTAGDPSDWEKLMPPGCCHLRNTGVSVSDTITSNAYIMMFTCTSYLVIQLPALMVDNKEHSDAERSSRESLAALIGMILCFAEWCGYLWKQWRDAQSDAAQSAVEDHQVQALVEAIKEGRITLRGAMADFKQSQEKSANGLSESLMSSVPREQVRKMCKILAPFYAYYDLNHDNKIDFQEFSMIFRDIHETMDRDVQKQLFEHSDVDSSGYINFEEFVACIIHFALSSPPREESHDGRRRSSAASFAVYMDKHVKSDDGEEDDEEDSDEEEDMPDDLADLTPEEQQRRVQCRAAYLLSWGTLLILVFSDPMVATLAEVGYRLNMSPFYVSFVVAPLASNASELVSAYNYATKRTQKSMTISLSTLEGAACMNNTFCLGIFLALIYFRGLSWNFTSETLSIIVVEIILGLYASSRTVMRLGEAACILMLWPLSLLLVYYLKNWASLD